jgi:hypothetical protein
LALSGWSSLKHDAKAIPVESEYPHVAREVLCSSQFPNFDAEAFIETLLLAPGFLCCSSCTFED